MWPRSRIAGVLLLIAVVGASPGIHVFAFSATRPVHPAGCHSDEPTTPSNTPIGYQCCAGAHRAAIPNAAFSFRPLVARFVTTNEGDRLLVAPFSVFLPTLLVTPACSPPGDSPLRI